MINQYSTSKGSNNTITQIASGNGRTHQSVTTDKPLSIEDSIEFLKIHLITNIFIRQLDELAERGHKVITIIPLYDPKDGNVYDFKLEFERTENS